MKPTLSAVAVKRRDGYQPQIQVHFYGIKPVTHGAKVRFVTEADALEFARREIEESKKTGWIGW